MIDTEKEITIKCKSRMNWGKFLPGSRRCITIISRVRIIVIACAAAIVVTA
jgi:hypothetical protein